MNYIRLAYSRMDCKPAYFRSRGLPYIHNGGDYILCDHTTGRVAWAIDGVLYAFRAYARAAPPSKYGFERLEMFPDPRTPFPVKYVCNIKSSTQQVGWPI